MTMACVRPSEVSSRIGCRTTARTSRSFRGEIRVAPCRSNSQESRRAEPPSESSNSPAECVARVKVFRGLDVIAAEYKATDQVPSKARAFTGWDQFTLWFAAASLPAAWLYGGYMTGAYGLPGAFALIFLVSTLTFIPWALIGYIAADKGASSVSLLRPAFGLRGSKLPSVFYLFFGYGWAAVNVFIAAISMSFVFNLTLGWPDAFHTPAGSPINYYLVPSILSICFLQGLFATAGHRAIRYLNWASTVALVGLGAYASYIVLKDFDFGQLLAWRPTQPLSFTFTAGALGSGFTYTLTLPLLLDLLIAYNWTWEFIGDFSRFARSKRAGTWGPFAGASLAQYWFFSVGALMTVAFLVTDSPGSVNFAAISDPSYKATQLGFGLGAYLLSLFATISTNAGNSSASALGITTIPTRSFGARGHREPIFPSSHPAPPGRAASVVARAAIRWRNARRRSCADRRSCRSHRDRSRKPRSRGRRSSSRTPSRLPFPSTSRSRKVRSSKMLTGTSTSTSAAGLASRRRATVRLRSSEPPKANWIG